MIKRLIDMVRGIKYHDVTFYAVGVMSNTYKIGTFKVKTDRATRKIFGGEVAKVAFDLNRKKLLKHYKAEPDGFVYHYSTSVEVPINKP